MSESIDSQLLTVAKAPPQGGAKPVKTGANESTESAGGFAAVLDQQRGRDTNAQQNEASGAIAGGKDRPAGRQEPAADPTPDGANSAAVAAGSGTRGAREADVRAYATLPRDTKVREIPGTAEPRRNASDAMPVEAGKAVNPAADESIAAGSAGTPSSLDGDITLPTDLSVGRPAPAGGEAAAASETRALSEAASSPQQARGTQASPVLPPSPGAADPETVDTTALERSAEPEVQPLARNRDTAASVARTDSRGPGSGALGDTGPASLPPGGALTASGRGSDSARFNGLLEQQDVRAPGAADARATPGDTGFRSSAAPGFTSTAPNTPGAAGDAAQLAPPADAALSESGEGLRASAAGSPPGSAGPTPTINAPASVSTAPTTGPSSADGEAWVYDMEAAPDDVEFPREMSSRVSVMLRDGNREARLQLHPAELGRVQVTINTDGDQARVVFTAESAAAREAIEQAMPRLREALAQQGMSLAQADVGQQGPSGDRGAGRDAPPPGSPDAADGLIADTDPLGDTTVTLRATARLDLYA